MAELSYKAIINLLENDESGRTSLDAVKMVTRMIKSKGFAVHEKVVDIFLHLRLMDEMAPISSSSQDDSNSKKRKAKDKPFMTKKARKAMKETKEIEKEFQEAEAVVSKEEKDKTVSIGKALTTRMLTFTFFIAHRNLKVGICILLPYLEETNFLSAVTWCAAWAISVGLLF